MSPFRMTNIKKLFKKKYQFDQLYFLFPDNYIFYLFTPFYFIKKVFFKGIIKFAPQGKLACPF